MSEVQDVPETQEVESQEIPESVSSEPVIQAAPEKPAPSKLDALKEASKKANAEAKTETPTPEKPETPAQAAATQVPNPYKPNFKMKVDKVEKEIDEFFRALIKDAESEEKVRKTLQKAEAFESQTQRHERLKQEHEEISTKYSGIDRSLRQLSKHLNEDDMETFCASLKIDDEKILRYAKRILDRREMDPNQRAEQDRIRQDRLRAYQLEEQNQTLQTQYQRQQAETGLMQTEMLLNSRPEYAQVAQAFDNHVKREGAFFEEVCKQGVLAEKTTGKILTPEEAVQAALQVWGPFLGAQQTAVQPQTQVAPQTTPQPKTPPPTLPNISARAASPIKQPVRSIADLKKLANQF